MGLQKQVSRGIRNDAKKKRDALKATSLYKSVDEMMKSLENFWKRNPVIGGELAKKINMNRKHGEEMDALLKKQGEEMIEATRKRIFQDTEAKLLACKIKNMSDEVEILKKSGLWQN